MAQRPIEILLVEGDGELAEMLQEHLQGSALCNVTVASSAADALREELTARHDLVLAALELPDGDGLSLVRELRGYNRCPVLLMADEITLEQALEALRIGVADVLIKPFDLSGLTSIVELAARQEVKRRRLEARYRRLRRLASRIVRERRDVHQRMDLICRDFVQAYRRLAEKVTESGLLPQE